MYLPSHDEEKRERIRQRAHDIFLKRSGDGGDHVSDCLQAEIEIHEEYARQHKGPARSPDRSKWGHVTHPTGHDVENPT
jgi:hypothetical protein